MAHLVDDDGEVAIEKPRAFVSYARSDGESIATSLRERIEREHPEITLWQDRVRMEGGVGWWRQITEAIDHVQFLILVMTPAASVSDVVRREWLYARNRGVCVYPVIASGLKVSFKTLPRWMRKAHFFNLDKEWNTFVNYLKSPCRATRVPFMAPDLPSNYVKRSSLVEQVRDELLQVGAAGVALTTAIRGAGGLGKTTLAAALCHDADVLSHFDDGILWVTLGKQPQLVVAIQRLYSAITGKTGSFVDADDAAYNLSVVLQDRHYLIVVDDVWEQEHLKPFLSGGRNCVRLITTRIADVALRIQTRWVIDEMSIIEATSLLMAGIVGSEKHIDVFQTLARKLGAWPLLLELSNAALKIRIGRGDSLNGALHYIARKLDKLGVIAFDARDSERRNEAISQTLDLSIDLLSENEQQLCCQLSVFPEDEDIPGEIVGRLWETNEFETEELLQTIDNTSLIQFNAGAKTIRIHDIVRSYLERKVSELSALHLRLVRALFGESALEVYRWRWLSYHLIQAGEQEQVREMLLNPDWLLGKLARTSFSQLIVEFDWFPLDPSLRFISDALRLSSYALLRDPTQLAGQLLARMPMQGEISVALKGFRSQLVRADVKHWLRPRTAQLTSPGGALVQTLVGHEGPVRAIHLGADQRVASGSTDGTIRLWDLKRGNCERELIAHKSGVLKLSWSPTFGLISFGVDEFARAWDLVLGREVAEFAVAGTNEGVFATTEAGLLVVHPRSRIVDRSFAAYEHPTCFESSIAISALTYVPNRSVHPIVAVVGCYDGSIGLFDNRCGIKSSTKAHDGRVAHLASCEASNHFVSIGADDVIKLWRISDGTILEVMTVTRSAYYASCVAIARDLGSIVVGSNDSTVTVWNLRDRSKSAVLEGHISSINAVAVTHDMRLAISASDDKTIRVWDLAKGSHRKLRGVHGSPVHAICITPDGLYVLTTSDFREIQVWNSERAEIAQTILGRGIWQVYIAPDRRYAVWATPKRTLHCWKLDGSSPLSCSIVSSRNTSRALIVPINEQLTLAFDASGEVFAWNKAERREVVRVRLDSASYRSFAYSQVTSGFLLLEEHDYVTRWQPGTEVHRVARRESFVNAAFSSNSSRLVLLDRAGRFAIFDSTAGVDILVPTELSPNNVTAISFGCDDSYVACTTNKGDIEIVDVSSGKRICSAVIERPIRSCAVSPRSHLIVIGDEQGFVHFYDLILSF